MPTWEPRTGYAVRPGNVLRPLVFGVRAWVTLREQQYPEMHRDLVVSPRRIMLQDGRIVQFQLRVARERQAVSAGFSVPNPKRVPGAMRACLNGTGYR